MFLVDANVLVYAVNASMPRHARSQAWIERALNSSETVGFAWLAMLAFLRLTALAALFPEPLETSTALDLIDEWLTARPAVVLHPTARHASVLRGLLEQSGTAGNLVSDAHLAALSLEHNATICTFDRDFNRFPGVKVFTPS